MRSLLLAVAVLSLSASARAALTPAQLTPDEQKVYETVKNDPTTAKKFLDTRDFLRQCQQVAAKKLPAIKLPRQPLTYDAQYVSDDEQSIVDDAVMKYVSARINGTARV